MWLSCMHGHSVKSDVRLSPVQKEAKEITGRYKQTAVGSKMLHVFALLSETLSLGY